MTAHRTRRGLLAFVALLAGWLAGSVAVWAFEGLLVDNPLGIPGMLWFTALVGFFAGLAWLVSVLPVSLFADHRRWFFRPAAAPFVGAGCGALLLTIESWIFFGVPPWDYPASPGFGDAYLLGIAVLIGAVAWTVYTLGVRAWRRTTPPPDPDPDPIPR